MRLAERAGALRVGRSPLRLELPSPAVFLGALIVAQFAALGVFVATVRHNSWLFYQGGDQTFYYTTAWLISHWHLPTTPIGYGWSYLTSPVALFAGSDFLDALPALLLLQVLVLLPIALLCVYGIASRLGGRALGYLAATMWVAAPYAVIPLWDQRYHQKWVELFLPQAFGLTNLADFPSMVCLLVAAYFTFRALDDRNWHDVAAAGLAAGFAVGIKPGNGIFLGGPLLAFLLARRWRQLGVFAAAVAPALVTLAIWKERGLGVTPALAYGDSRYAAAILPIASVLSPVTKYVHIDWGQLGHNLDITREFFWSVRPLEYLPFAGAIAVARRSVPKAALLAAWFFGFLLIKGSASQANVEDSSFFRLMMPAFPAYLLLAASIPLLVPAYGTRLAARFPARSPRFRIGTRSLAVATAVFALIPLVIVIGLRSNNSARAVKYFDQGVFVPVSPQFRPTASEVGGRVVVRWHALGASVPHFYRVLRSRAFDPAPRVDASTPAHEGVQCLRSRAGRGALDCRLSMDTVSVTSSSEVTDAPGPGRWTYRVGLSANWLNDTDLGDLLLVSPPATVTVAGQ
jgi:Dolichyl-phosphate-mannose-protein mannosyltransferase